MKIYLTTFLLFVLLFWLANCHTTKPTAANYDQWAIARKHYVTEVNEAIKGKEQWLVDSVFSNLKVLGGFPAENLVFAMDKWAQALGVDCTHCHNTANWASDEKPAKEIARQMVNLGERVNADLRLISGLKSEQPKVNCITCHRGDLKPALRME
ncbi:MAG TPA: c-type cytochrome [Saprospiraceae bacterium]|nr:c-type cytochrome [Saprospiraceae bacterium]HMQ82290.1 c-type cytochrome [Saprospiraceae bacterium]